MFGADSVTNVGELLGSALEVRVSGGLSEEDPADLTAPKRFNVDITRGQLCLLGGSDLAGGVCAPLPIKGEGVFDGECISASVCASVRTFNGGGARIVQRCA